MALGMSLRGLLCVAAGMAALPALTALAAAPAERWTLLTQGNPAGYQELRHAADGGLDVHFEFNDRGRGPKLDSHYRLAADGTPLRVDTQGLNYYKAAVSEHYTRKGAAASWKSSSENEQRTLAGPAFYLSVDGAPQELVLLAQALLKAPQQRLDLLPAGEARLQKLDTLEVPAPVPGKEVDIQVTLYALSGLDLTPDYLWLDGSGRFFASYSAWQTLVRQGYEGVVPQLAAAQDAQDHKLSEARAQAQTRWLEHPLAIEHVRVFDPDTLSAKPGQTVLVTDGHIAAVGADGALKLPDDAEKLDGQDRFLMPGLWDMHVHLAANDGPLEMAAGITTVRDLGNDPAELKALDEAAESGHDIGPRVIKAGLIDGHGPYQSPIKIFADTPEEAVKMVDQYADQGYEQIKIYSSVKPELVPVMVKEARARGLRVSGHVPAFMNAEQFIGDGVDEIQHINFLFLNFLFDQVKDTRTPARFTEVAKHAAELDLSSPRVTQFVQLMRERHIVSDPTLVAFEDMFLSRPGLMCPCNINIIDRLPLTWQRQLRASTQGLPVPPGMDARYRESFARMVQMVGLLYRSGVTIVAGTDGFDALSLQHEFELYVQAGIPPAEVLRLDTLGAARVMNRDGRFGRIAPGYVSDLILVDGDPTLNISDIRKVRVVLRGDRLYDANALWESMGVKAAP